MSAANVVRKAAICFRTDILRRRALMLFLGPFRRRSLVLVKSRVTPTGTYRPKRADTSAGPEVPEAWVVGDTCHRAGHSPVVTVKLQARGVIGRQLRKSRQRTMEP